MGWKITPNTGLASIDGNGKATFQKHTADTVYTVAYDEPYSSCTEVSSRTVTVLACYTPPTYYTYTVNSNQNGASVRWSNGSTGVILNGTSTISLTTNSPLTVSISKTNCTFNPSTGTCNANSSVTLNGSCYTPPGACSFKVTTTPGATVTFKYTASGTSKTALRTAGSNGVASFTTTDASSVTASAAKDGCTFSPSLVSISCGGSATINGSCCNSCSDIDVNYVRPYAVSSAGGTNLQLFTFRTLKCVPSLSDVSIVEVDSSIVSNIILMQVTQDTWAVYGDVEANDGAERYIYLSIRFKGTECSAAGVFQNQNECTCSSINLYQSSVSFPSTGTLSAIVGTVRSGCKIESMSRLPYWLTLSQLDNSILLQAHENTTGSSRGTGVPIKIKGTSPSEPCVIITVGQAG